MEMTLCTAILTSGNPYEYGPSVAPEDGRISERHGNTRVDTLRETYGDDFTPGVRGDAHLRTVLDRTGAPFLSKLVRKC